MVARSTLETALLTAQALVASLEAALAVTTDSSNVDSELLDLPALRARFGLGRASVLGAVERGELTAARGARGKILVRHSAVEAWLASRPVTARKPVARPPAASLDDWELAQQRELHRASGGS